jgi:hypothetical protein
MSALSTFVNPMEQWIASDLGSADSVHLANDRFMSILSSKREQLSTEMPGIITYSN